MTKILFILTVCFIFCSYLKWDGKDATKKNLVEVNFRMVICQGQPSQWCLQVKEKTDTNWYYFNDKIEGFNYEWGYHYVLDVEQKEIKNATQDAISIKWILRSIIKKTNVQSNTIFDLELGGEKIIYDSAINKISILNQSFSLGKNFSARKLKKCTVLRFRFVAGNLPEVFEGK